MTSSKPAATMRTTTAARTASIPIKMVWPTRPPIRRVATRWLAPTPMEMV
jgi:hypothetical protein